jgi:MFS family permease
VAIAAEIGMYLPVPLFGYLCDRYTPSPLSLLAAIFFGPGYLLAAFAYKNGPPLDAGGSGWPFWVMALAFSLVGMGTSCMYLGAVTACAKNFGRGRYRGIMLAAPIAAFGLSGMWQSQVGTYLLSERLDDGSRGEVDVFRYFVFLALLLLGVGLGGTVGLRLVDDDEEKYIDEAVSELERSGILGESEFFRSRDEVSAAYGTFQRTPEGDRDGEADEEQPLSLAGESHETRRHDREKERRKKNWLLNQETRLFLRDHTMWLLAGGFFLVTGPSEAYLNNVCSTPLFPLSWIYKYPTPLLTCFLSWERLFKH